MKSRLNDSTHISVLLQETMSIINAGNGRILVDATLGLGGHSESILTSMPEARLLGIDQDREALSLAKKRLAGLGNRFEAMHGNFADIRNLVAETEFERPDAIIADLGVSSLQLDDAERGFSFRFDAPLDMRMDANSDQPTAAELLADISEFDLAKIIYEYGEERKSRRIARRIIERNKSEDKIETTRDLAELVERTVRRKPNDKIHPATRTFQAIRIAVNRELQVLETFLSDTIEILAENGRLAVITFHSLEDRIVKHAFQKFAGKCSCPPRIPQCVCGAKKRVEILTKKPIIPSMKEQSENPRSRSAKLRAYRKLAAV